ncbi:Probable receptor-like protein kinase At1g80640 [Linum perenne]
MQNEVKWLTKFDHQNIVSVLGQCSHDGTRFLVYEMMQNGSLESQLHGLEYLHEHCNPPVVHRDIKSSNILLDSDFNAKAMPQLTDRSKLPNIVDVAMKHSMDLKHLYQVAAVAVLCVQQEPSYRPLITDVLHSLIPLVPLELGGSLRVYRDDAG